MSLNLVVPTGHDIPFQGLFKDFWGIFSRSFQGLFFVLSNIHSGKNYQQWTFQIRHTETIWSWVPQKNCGKGGFGYVFLTFSDDLLYYGYNTGSNNSAWKEVWGSSPRKILLELVQNPAILDNSGGYTSLLCHNKSRDCPFWNRLIHWNTYYT